MNGAISSLVVAALVVIGIGCSARTYVRRDAPAAGVVRMPRVAITNGPPEWRQYDQELADSIQDRWYDLVDTSPPDNYREGKVVLRFALHDDGRVTSLTIQENTTDSRNAWLCQKAVMDRQPFKEWPEVMRLMTDTNSRSITLTFYYNGK